MRDTILIAGRATVECFRGDYRSREEAIRAEGKPYEVLTGENIALNEGMDAMQTLLCGGIMTPFNHANARIGVGDSSEAAVRTQTGLLAEVVVDNAEVNWTAAPNVTSALDVTERRVGASSVRLSVADLFTTGLLAHRDRALINLAAFKLVRFWIRSSAARAAGDLRLLLDDTAACISPLEALSIPALTAGVWREVTIAVANRTLLTEIISVGIRADVDPGISTIWLDDIKAVTTWYKGMDTGFPTFGTEQRSTYRATFAGDEANFRWREWTIDNGLADSPINLNRGLAELGIKIPGSTRTLTVEILLSPA